MKYTSPLERSHNNGFNLDPPLEGLQPKPVVTLSYLSTRENLCNKTNVANNNLRNLFITGPKAVSKWISLKEIKIYMFIAVWIAQCIEYLPHFLILRSRIMHLHKHHGWNFTFSYLKLCVQLTIQAINHTPLFTMSEPRVRRDHYGMPTIIPGPLRSIIRNQDHVDWLKVTKATITCLSVFRVFPTKVSPSLETITAPFSGLSQTIDKSTLHTVLNAMRIRLKPGVFKGFISESAGPNGSKATWTSHLDALSFLAYPKQLISFHLLAFRYKSLRWAIWLDLLIVIMLPLMPIYWLWSFPLKMGKLSVVYDQAGKARIVAITNWWIQLALLPLHNSIFDYLRSLDCDGTFNQDGALAGFMARRDPAHSMYSFDLSAATDRLPIQLQVDILSHLGYPARLWRNLLDFGWMYKGEGVKYSVGQPMGAYSSWAMLALTHHVIVRVAAHQAGIRVIPNYVVLGDDIVINHDLVAQQYRIIMSALGVNINMSKSLVSKDMCEFAKRWVTQDYDLTPLGPGNILVCLREPFFLGTLVSEAQRKGFFDSSISLRAVIDSLPSKYFRWKDLSVALWTAIGIPKNPHLFAKGVEKSPSAWYAFERGIIPAHRDLSLYRSLIAIIHERNSNALSIIEDKELEFDRTWFHRSKTLSKDPSLRLLERLIRYFSPAYWCYALSFPKDYERQLLRVEELKRLFPVNTPHGGHVYGEVDKLIAWEPSINGNSIDWRDRNQVKLHARFFTELEKSFIFNLRETGRYFYQRQYPKW